MRKDVALPVDVQSPDRSNNASDKLEQARSMAPRRRYSQILQEQYNFARPSDHLALLEVPRVVASSSELVQHQSERRGDPSSPTLATKSREKASRARQIIGADYLSIALNRLSECA